MKKLIYSLSILFVFSINLYSQNFSDIVNLNSNGRAKNIVKANSRSLLRTLTPPDTIKEIVIISMDPSSGCNLPSWFNDLFNIYLPSYFNESTLNNYVYSPIVIKRDATHAFELESVPSDHDHGQINIDSVLFKADPQINFSQYDWNNDRIVEVHFTSIGSGNWGVVGNVHDYTSRDSVLVGGIKRPIIVRVDHQSRGINRDNYYGVIVHENGHYYFDLIDQDHSWLTTFNHWGSGSFDVMSDVLGFVDANNNLQPSPYSPVYSDVTILGNKWSTAIPITSNNQNFVLSDYQSSKSLYVYTPSSLPSNAVANEKFYLSYIKPTLSYAFSCFPLTDRVKGGVLIWHVKGNGLLSSGDFWNWYSKDFDIEAALGKTNWTDDQYDTGISNPISGRDKLEVRKVVNGAIVGGPYTGAGVFSAGEEGIFYIPGDNKKFNFYSNPNSNWYNQNETYAHNILSGFAFKNFRYESGQAKADININHYSIDENTTLSTGKWYFNNTITVNAGVTLTIQPGTELYFSTNANLVVNGTLNAVGTSASRIKFDKISTSSNWNGISMGSGSSGNIQYCDIKNANYGFSISYVSPLIKYCNISNNGVGISLSYWANPTLVGNTINNNTSHGIACYYYSSPRLNDYYSDSNVIKDNGGCGVSANYNSNPVLSKGSYSSGNSIKGNASYEVSANSNCTVDATNVWWNVTSSPYYNTADFLTQNTSTISYDPARPADPNPGRSIQSNPEENNVHALGTINLSMQAGDNDLTSALDKQKDKKYDEAIGLYLNVFKNNKDVLLGKYALSKIEECFTQAGKKDYLTYSKTEIKPLLKEGSETYVVALELETHQMVSAGLYKDAVNNLQTILKKYNLNSAIEKNTLFTLGAFYSLYFGDKDNSDKYFEELRKKYPKDELVNQIEIIKTFGAIANSSVQSAEMISFSEEAVTETEKEISQDMVSNYPNPFNPTTRISFTLKNGGKVSLKIYDVLGKEVANLAEGYYEAGKHVAAFDGSNLASGVYLYRLVTPNAAITKKMVLTK